MLMSVGGFNAICAKGQYDIVLYSIIAEKEGVPLATYNLQNNYSVLYYYGKDLAHKLKAMGISAIQAQDKRLELQLRFYGISNDSPRVLHPARDLAHYDVSLEYLGRTIARYEIIKDSKTPPHR